VVAVEAQGVSYHRAGQALVQRVSVAALRGEVLALAGERGAGTSTLLGLLAGTLLPDAGRIVVDGFRPDLAGPSGSWSDPRRHGAGAGARRLVGRASSGSVLLLDEPTQGLPAGLHDGCWHRLRAAADAGPAVVVATHDLDRAARFADVVALLAVGRLLAWAPPALAFVPTLRLLDGEPRRLDRTLREALPS
jgi:ABC-type hemin transport system ATPase subunit